MATRSKVARPRFISSPRSCRGQLGFDFRRREPSRIGRRLVTMLRLTGTTWRELPGGGIHFAPAESITAAGYELGAALDIPAGKFRFVGVGTAPHNLETIDIDGAWFAAARRRSLSAVAVLLEEIQRKRQKKTAAAFPFVPFPKSRRKK